MVAFPGELREAKVKAVMCGWLWGSEDSNWECKISRTFQFVSFFSRIERTGLWVWSGRKVVKEFVNR